MKRYYILYEIGGIGRSLSEAKWTDNQAKRSSVFSREVLNGFESAIVIFFMRRCWVYLGVCCAVLGVITLGNFFKCSFP